MDFELLTEDSRLVGRHIVRASYHNQFAPIGSREENTKFYVKAKSKAHAVERVKAHLEGKNHRNVFVKHQGLVKESIENDDGDTHRVHASYHFDGAPEEDVFNVKAKSKAHALNKVGTHLSKHKASKIKLTHLGIKEKKPKPEGQLVSLAKRGHYHKKEVRRLLGLKDEAPKPKPQTDSPKPPSNVISLTAARDKKNNEREK